MFFSKIQSQYQRPREAPSPVRLVCLEYNLLTSRVRLHISCYIQQATLGLTRTGSIAFLACSTNLRPQTRLTPRLTPFLTRSFGAVRDLRCDVLPAPAQANDFAFSSEQALQTPPKYLDHCILLLLDTGQSQRQQSRDYVVRCTSIVQSSLSLVE